MKVVLVVLLATVAYGAIPDPISPEYVPRPEGLIQQQEVNSQILDFPSSENPMIRFHINVKGSAINELQARRVARSIGGLLLPPWVFDPQTANPLPEFLPPAPEHLPEILPEVETGIRDYIFRWPDTDNQLVKLKVRVNEDAFKPKAEILPARSFDPVYPMPAIPQPNIEVFIDIGEQVKYW